jgi:predicted SprT family Zn-dependent metalloprotease
MEEKYFIKNEFYVGILLEQLMVKNELEGWKYGFCDSVCCGGWTEYDNKKILISRDLINAKNTSFSDIKDVVLHEIAHAIDECKNNHGPIWWKISKDIGCKLKTERCIKFKVPLYRFRYILNCPKGCTKNKTFKPRKYEYCKKHKKRMKILKNLKFKKIKRKSYLYNV